MKDRVEERARLLIQVQGRMKYVLDQITEATKHIQVLREAVARHEAHYDSLVEWVDELAEELPADARPGAGREGNEAAKFRNLTVGQALKVIAKENGNRLVAKNAKKRLEAAGVFVNPKNSAAIIYAEINRGTKRDEWDKEKPGIYRLITSEAMDVEAMRRAL